jgi:DNA-binding beta-propeller fold protein YncE
MIVGNMKTNKALSYVQVLAAVGLLSFSGGASALLPFAKTGNLYVSMWTSDEIAVFTPDGTPVERFTASGLDGPRGIAFNPANGEIWIAGEFSNAIYIFDHQHQFLRTLEHEDFNEPVGVTFRTVDADAADALVYISNSNGNEIMVFNQAGELQRRFSGPDLSDPNCSAFMADGSLFVSNRLGGSGGVVGSVSSFDAQESFLFDFTTTGIASLMAVARDPNMSEMNEDDTLWVTSGGGDTGIYEFDQSGNLLNTLLPADIGDGRSITPQGIAFDSNGDFYVVSFLNEVLKFDSDGNFISRFPTGDGTSRSTAFQGCRADVEGSCVPLGVEVSGEDADGGGTETEGTGDGTDADDAGEEEVTDSSSGGGALSLWLAVGLLGLARRRLKVGSALS